MHSYNGLIDNNWKYSSSTTGTDIWETNSKNKSISDPLSTSELYQIVKKNAQNLNISQLLASNHFGGTWGEDDSLSINYNRRCGIIHHQMVINNNNSGLDSNTASINNNWMVIIIMKINNNGQNN